MPKPKKKYTKKSNHLHQSLTYHYDNNPNKSQWTPKDYNREFKLFEEADRNDWAFDDGKKYAAVDLDENRNPILTGYDKMKSGMRDECYVAVFVNESESPDVPWHGYPIGILEAKGKVHKYTLKALFKALNPMAGRKMKQGKT